MHFRSVTTAGLVEAGLADTVFTMFGLSDARLADPGLADAGLADAVFIVCGLAVDMVLLRSSLIHAHFR